VIPVVHQRLFSHPGFLVFPQTRPGRRDEEGTITMSSFIHRFFGGSGDQAEGNEHGDSGGEEDRSQVGYRQRSSSSSSSSSFHSIPSVCIIQIFEQEMKAYQAAYDGVLQRFNTMITQRAEQVVVVVVVVVVVAQTFVLSCY